MNPHSFTNTHKSTHVHTAALTQHVQSKDAPDCVKQALKSSSPSRGIGEKRASERASGEEEAISLAGKMP